MLDHHADPIALRDLQNDRGGLDFGTDSSRSPSTGFGRRLRAATDPLHRRLDAGFEGIARDAGVYRRFIATNHAARHRLEPIVESAAVYHPVIASYEPLRHHLDRDMDALDLDRLDIAETPDLQSDAATAAGILYVLEGSRLGARMIAREIAAAGLLDRGTAMSTMFLSAAAERFDFRGRLEALGLDLMRTGGTMAVERAEAAATTVFAIYLQCLYGGETAEGQLADVVSEEA